MGIVDSKTGKEKIYSVEELKEAANEMRGYTLAAISLAGSGHPGGSLSSMDLFAALFLNKMRHDPKNTEWDERDRFFLSKAHVVPALYAAMGKSGYYPIKETATLRKLHSPFQGHCDRLKMKGMEMSGGSLGQGLGIAVGDALAAKLDGKKYRVYCLMGDGEQQEGSIWESAMSAGNFKLDNLTAIVDKNGLQIDGKVCTVMNVDPLAEKYKAFNWNVIEIDGHNMQQILDALEQAEKFKEKPSVIIMKTVKGKGVSFMENVAGWHGQAPSTEQLLQALEELGLKDKIPFEEMKKLALEHQEKTDKELEAKIPKFKNNYWWNSTENMQAEMKPTRMGWGEALSQMGSDERICTIHADISGSIKISDFEADNPERCNRVFSVGIAEQNMMQVAAGLAKEGKIPITGTYGVFASGRPWDQIRTTICYANLNVKIGGAHGGVSVGPDGATHQSLEEIAIMGILPNMKLFVPCDSIETNKATKESTLNVVGPCYVRFARESTPIVTTSETPFVLGKANVIRFRGEKDKFVEAFETVLGEEYKDENEDLSFIACGPMVPEAMRAAWILKKEHNIESRIVNIHTVKPIDDKTIIKAARETKALVTAEEHQAGGFGNIVAGVIATDRDFTDDFVLDMVGVQDRFGESGQSWELMKEFELTAEFLVEKALALLKRKK